MSPHPILGAPFSAPQTRLQHSPRAVSPVRKLRRGVSRWMLHMALMGIMLDTSLWAGPAGVGTNAGNVPARADDKGQYNLFNPTPRELMREMSTDRPDTTESPATVDAGHVQIETSIFDYGRTRQSGVTEEVFTWGAMNVKLGLLNNTDIQFVFDAYTEVRTNDHAADTTETVEGFSDLQVRLKVNLWGNDGGRTALAFFPFIKIPTGSDLSNDNVEGGVILPFSVELNDRVGLGLMFETDFVYDEESRGYEAEFVHTAVLGFSLTDKLGAFIEYAGIAGSTDFAYQAIADGGFTYAVTEDLRLDAGVRVGLNEAAEDFGAFAGLSVRF